MSEDFISDSSEPDIDNIEDIEEYLENVEPAPDDFSENFDADCVRKTGNFASSDSRYLFDYRGKPSNPEERVKLTRERLQYVSPKLLTMLDEIERQDQHDIADFGHTFKHFIFSNIKTGTGGAKIIATALIDLHDMNLGYELKGGKLAFTNEGENDRTFYLLSSVGVHKKPIPVPMRKEILKRFNNRPDNVHGAMSQIIVMDSGFKEGIDLFDVKYVHIFEPQTTFADQKQVIGRATRTCGQKGLEFHPNIGWQLHVNIYDLEIPEFVSFKFMGAKSVHEMYLKALGIDMRLIHLAVDMERVYIKGAVDHDLNLPIHEFSQEGGKKPTLSDDKKKAIEDILTTTNNKKLIDALVLPNARTNAKANAKVNAVLDDEVLDLLQRNRDARLIGALMNTPIVVEEMPQSFDGMRKYIEANYSHEYKWTPLRKGRNLENLCPVDEVNEPSNKSSIIHFNKTQNFVRRYFTPESDRKGILLAHSVGTGKTCSAIATATTSFEREGYTILWVTRTTLKTDIWKNMFDQICSDSLRQLGSLPSDAKARMRLLSKAWSIRPMSYKQFSNLVSGKNSMYQALVKRNGPTDPLRKTLLIIDEAHKLYGETDMSALEKPDMLALHESIMRSYEISGAESVRIMLMTATPITTSPMEFVKLMNLCVERPRQMDTEFPVFSQKYLDESGRFTGNGETRFLDEISGLVSYLNREKDARVFAQPIIKMINVPILKEGNLLFEEYDAPLIRALAKPQIAEMELKVKQDLEKIGNSYKKITAKSFDSIKSVCAGQKTRKLKTMCNQKAREAIKDVMNFVKERRGELNFEGNEIKESLKHFKKTLREKTDKINERVREHKTRKTRQDGGSSEDSGLDRPIENIDNDYQRYVQSVFHGIKSKCRIPPKRNVFNNFPVIVELQEDKAALQRAAKEKDKESKSFAKNVRIRIKGMTKGTQEIKDLKMEIKNMAIEKRKEIDELHRKMTKKDKYTRKIKQLLERKYKKSVKDREKMERDITNDVMEIDSESGELKKKVKEFHDLADIKEDDLREFVKMRYQEFVEGLKKEE